MLEVRKLGGDICTSLFSLKKVIVLPSRIQFSTLKFKKYTVSTSVHVIIMFDNAACGNFEIVNSSVEETEFLKGKF